MKTHIRIACIYTVVTAVVLGLVYPLVVTGIAQTLARGKANGQLIERNREVIGSELVGQPFTGPRYFHSRPSAAGMGYDATSSSGSNLAPTSKALADRIEASVKQENTGEPVPIDLVTASASGLDPDITPAAAFYQVARVAHERSLPKQVVQQLVIDHTTQRQFGLLGEPVVNVLDLNLALDSTR